MKKKLISRGILMIMDYPEGPVLKNGPSITQHPLDDSVKTLICFNMLVSTICYRSI